MTQSIITVNLPKTEISLSETSGENMNVTFPYYMEDDTSYVDVKEALIDYIPLFIWGVGQYPPEWMEQKFDYFEICVIDVVGIDRDFDEKYGIKWGATLRVTLNNGDYFLVYMPMYDHTLRDDVAELYSEIYHSIVVHSSDVPIDQFVIPHNVYKYQSGMPSICITRHELDNAFVEE